MKKTDNTMDALLSFCFKHLTIKNTLIIVLLYEAIFLYKLSGQKAFLKETAIDINTSTSPNYTAEQTQQLIKNGCVDPSSLDDSQKKLQFIADTLDVLQSSFPDKSKITKIIFCNINAPSQIAEVEVMSPNSDQKDNAVILLLHPEAIKLYNHQEIEFLLAHEAGHSILGHMKADNSYMMSLTMHRFTDNLSQAVLLPLICQYIARPLLNIVDEPHQQALRRRYSLTTSIKYYAPIFILPSAYFILYMLSLRLQSFEFEADASAIELIGKVHSGCLSFFHKSNAYNGQPIEIPPAEEIVNSSCLDDLNLGNAPSSITSFFTAHPDISRRVQAICTLNTTAPQCT